MKRRPVNAARLLRWYPTAWRQRYGDEFSAFLDDVDTEGPMTSRFKASIRWAGVRERGHASGLVGEQQPPTVQARAGALVVLCGWTAFLLAGASFSKLSEHFAKSMPSGPQSWAHGGFDLVVISGVTGTLLVLAGAVTASSSVAAYLRTGGWVAARRSMVTSLALTVLAMGTLVTLSRWSHHLTYAQRNGGSGLYATAFVAWALIVALTLASWTRVVVRCALRTNFSPRTLRWEALFATGVTCAMLGVTAGTALWWGVVGEKAAWFLQGSSYGSSASPFAPNLLVTMALMVAATVVGLMGVTRIARSWPSLR